MREGRNLRHVLRKKDTCSKSRHEMSCMSAWSEPTKYILINVMAHIIHCRRPGFNVLDKIWYHTCTVCNRFKNMILTSPAFWSSPLPVFTPSKSSNHCTSTTLLWVLWKLRLLMQREGTVEMNARKHGSGWALGKREVAWARLPQRCLT